VEVITPRDTSLFDTLDERSEWEATATLRIKRVDGSEGVDERAFEKALEAHGMKVEACYEQRWDGSHRQRLRLRLRFDAHGQLLDVELLEGSLGTDGDACVEAVLRKVAWRGLPSADATVTIELRLRM